MNWDYKIILELLLVGGTGLAITIAGAAIYLSDKRKIRRCTAMTRGTVIKHCYYGEGRMAPLISYSVQGLPYQVVRKYRGIITVKKLPYNCDTKSGAWVSEKDFLHVPMGAVTDLGEMAEKLWPIGSTMQVFYNPVNPKESFAEKSPEKLSVTSVIFICCGTFIIAVSIVVALLMNWA